MPLIAERVASARIGKNPTVICRMKSGWATLGDRQFPRGWCVLLADPVAPTLNDLDEQARLTFLSDMAALGDAVLTATSCRRINYAMYGNQEPELHAHVVPRYADEDPAMITKPVWLYPPDQLDGTPFDADRDADLMSNIRQQLEKAGRIDG